MPRNPLNPKRGNKNHATGRQNKKRFKNAGSRPQHSETMKRLWQDPVYRAKMDVRLAKMAEDRKANPLKYNRMGVPDGMTKKMVQPMWDRANELADRFIQILKDTGRL
jgi:hypothetical protein